jgi:DNA-binding XRE family transcriptional regulator
MKFRASFPSTERGPSFRTDSDYHPWDYYRSERTIALLSKQQPSAGKKRHVQPPIGPERAFGDALREIRKEHGISQEQLALDSGLDRTYVSLIERGSQSPTIRSVLKLANVLGVKPSEIIARMETLMPKSRPQRSRG